LREGVLVLDDSGFPKKGKCSAGVGRQYSGTLGRTDNCQVGVLVSYASEKGHTLVDRRLYLLRSWFEEEAVVPPKAGLPSWVGVPNEAELATGMLREISKAGHLPYRWVTADADYGDHHDLRQAVADLGAWLGGEPGHGDRRQLVVAPGGQHLAARASKRQQRISTAVQAS
jgi:SRSO17 transposase